MMEIKIKVVLVGFWFVYCRISSFGVVDELSSLASTFFEKSLDKDASGSSGGYFKYVGDKLIYSQPLVEPAKSDSGELIMNYQEDISLDSIDG